MGRRAHADAAREQLTISSDMIDAIDIQIGPVDVSLRAYARKQPVCRTLIDEIYGIGPLTSVTIVAELAQPRGHDPVRLHWPRSRSVGSRGPCTGGHCHFQASASSSSRLPHGVEVDPTMINDGSVHSNSGASIRFEGANADSFGFDTDADSDAAAEQTTEDEEEQDESTGSNCYAGPARAPRSQCLPSVRQPTLGLARGPSRVDCTGQAEATYGSQPY